MHHARIHVVIKKHGNEGVAVTENEKNMEVNEGLYRDSKIHIN